MVTESAKEKPHNPVPVPDSGDIVWLDFTPASGHEQNGRRPALVITPTAYNRASGLCFVLPVTSRGKGYPFEVELPPNLETSGFVPQGQRGFVLADQCKTVDWKTRNVSLTEKVPSDTLHKVRHLLKVLFVLEYRPSLFMLRSAPGRTGRGGRNNMRGYMKGIMRGLSRNCIEPKSKITEQTGFPFSIRMPDSGRESGCDSGCH